MRPHFAFNIGRIVGFAGFGALVGAIGSQLALSSTMNGVVDYISFDVDDATRAAFDNFPFDTFRCKTLTIEHDAYRVGNNLRDYIRYKLISYGYVLVFGNVVYTGHGAFEDWFVDPKYIDRNMLVNLMEIRCDNTDSTLIEQKLLTLNAS
jgi:hypothetical protein